MITVILFSLINVMSIVTPAKCSINKIRKDKKRVYKTQTVRRSGMNSYFKIDEIDFMRNT